VDDHEIVRIGVRLLLSDRDNWEVCSETGDEFEAVEKVAELSPDIVILDLTMPVPSGLDAEGYPTVCR
jgi:DNA-binding NarL/FixJ family response regulator